MTEFINLTLNGISTGAIYAAVALALVLIWRATRIVNFAQGAMLMITTFIASAVIDARQPLLDRTRSWRMLCGLVIGGVVERVLIRRVESAPPLNAVIVDARAARAARGRGRDDLGQHAALLPGRLLHPRLRGRRARGCCSRRTTRSSCSWWLPWRSR